MKCDVFLRSLHTGGFWKKSCARLHAMRCCQCAESLRLHRRIEQALTHPEPLTTEQRRLWKQAAVTDMHSEESVSVAPRSIRIVPRFAVAACLLFVITLGGWYTIQWLRPTHSPDSLTSNQDVDFGRSERLVVISRETTQQESRKRISQIESDLLQLSAELDELARHAALLEERRQIEDLLTEAEKSTEPITSFGG